MRIAGIQKASLIDYPGRVSCTLFLFGCNFRCGFCYNPDLVLGGADKSFSEEEVLDFLKKRRGKLDAVCITGGEPLLTLDFDFVRKIKELGYLVKLDTNGSFPERLKEMIDQKLVDYIAMDIKGSREKYLEIVDAETDLRKIEESIKLIHDFENYEFRTTVVSRFHDSLSMRAIGKWLNNICGGKPKVLFLQGFQAKEKFVDNDFLKEKSVSEKQLNELKEVVGEYFYDVGVRG